MIRVASIVVLLVLTAAGLAVDFIDPFWATHPFLASLLVNLLTLFIAILLVDWWLARRQTRSWYRLAALAYDGLTNAVRGAWIASLDATGRPIYGIQMDQMKATAATIHGSLGSQSADASFRLAYAARLQPVVDELGQAIRNWAGIMTADDGYATDINDAADLWQRIKNSQALLQMGQLPNAGTWALSPAEFVEFVREANRQALELDARFMARFMARRRRR